MRNFFIGLFFSLMVFFITGCQEVLDIEFVNNTDFTLVCQFDYRELSDTILHENTPWPKGVQKTDCIIKPHSTHLSRFNQSDFIGLEEKGLCRSFYFFDVDTINAVPWERIRSENIVVKKVYIYSLNDIKYKFDNVIYIP